MKDVTGEEEGTRGSAGSQSHLTRSVSLSLQGEGAGPHPLRLPFLAGEGKLCAALPFTSPLAGEVGRSPGEGEERSALRGSEEARKDRKPESTRETAFRAGFRRFLSSALPRFRSCDRPTTSRYPLIFVLAVCLSGCMLPMAGRDVTPPAVVLAGTDIAGYLEIMERLGSADPEDQGDLFREIERAYTEAPTTVNSLRYALALVTPGHPASNTAAAHDVLEMLLASPERLLANERVLAAVFFQEADARVGLETETSRLLATVDERTRAQANSERRAQTQAEENARLRKALEEAQAKLDAIRDIERSIIERNPSPAGTPGSRSESNIEAQGPAPGR